MTNDMIEIDRKLSEVPRGIKEALMILEPPSQHHGLVETAKYRMGYCRELQQRLENAEREVQVLRGKLAYAEEALARLDELRATGQA